MPELKELTLATVAGGAAIELFEHALPQILANMRDPNTDAKEKRKITLEIAFTPHESQGYRDEAAVDVKMKLSLAGIRTARGVVFMGRENGELVARTYNVRQEELLEQAEKDGTLKRMPAGA